MSARRNMIAFFAKCKSSSDTFSTGAYDSVAAVVVTPRSYSVAAGCNYGSDPDCLFPCHCFWNCDPTRGCTDDPYTCESLTYVGLDDNDGRTFSGPQCQIGEFH